MGKVLAMMIDAPEQTELRLAVSEVFGPTFQGEGVSLGRLCAFLRLAGCNLTCTWCDTAYTWDWTGHNGKAYDPAKEVSMLEVGIVQQRLESMGVTTLVVSGGEPLLQAKALTPLLRTLGDAHWWREVETNGTIVPDMAADCFDRFTVSLKLPHSGNASVKAVIPDAIEWYRRTGRAVWKFVAQDLDDLDQVKELEREFALNPIYIMPEGRDAFEVLAKQRALADHVLARGWNMTTRLHTLLWGDVRGR